MRIKIVLKGIIMKSRDKQVNNDDLQLTWDRDAPSHRELEKLAGANPGSPRRMEDYIAFLESFPVDEDALYEVHAFPEMFTL